MNCHGTTLYYTGLYPLIHILTTLHCVRERSVFVCWPFVGGVCPCVLRAALSPAQRYIPPVRSFVVSLFRQSSIALHTLLLVSSLPPSLLVTLAASQYIDIWLLQLHGRASKLVLFGSL